VARLSITIEGIVQGVGFRPFVHAIATRHGLAGWVRNDADGVHVEVEGETAAIDAFLSALGQPPPAARIDRILTRSLPENGGMGHGAQARFLIQQSATSSVVRPTLPADLATCPECTREVDTPSERRHRYPFTNCTQCGPRYTIIEALPYDRPRTSMRGFPLCEACDREYRDPADRRFHAQPIACPACGPRVQLVGSGGERLAGGDEALRRAAAALRAGAIVALKGLGGFQLLCDATSEAVVARLRERKRREEKPLALMAPTIEAVRELCELTEEEAGALRSPASPILLVRRARDGSEAARPVAPSIAPGNPRLGVMLPYTPLHRLLLEEVGRPLVCTSGNLSEEPMCTREEEAYERLGDIADLFLVHDRPIVRPVDDSVARVGPRGLEVVRRARGFAPIPLPLAGSTCVVAVGGQLKNTVALATGQQVIVSQHVGDLFSPEGALLCARTVDDLVTFFGASPDQVACDLHPDYASSRLAEELAARWRTPLVRVQHHHAHIAACVAEHALAGPVLGLAWDGSGLGTDGTVWGGEALVVDGAAFSRVAHIRPFSLPGGERAIREPRRSAAGLLYEVFGREMHEHLSPVRRRAGRRFGHSPETSDRLLTTMLARSVNTPRTTSIGRLFDAVAALTGVRTRATFEGQAAMELESAAEGVDTEIAYPFPLRDGLPAVADWEPLVHALLADVRAGVSADTVSARFHNALVDLADAIAARAGLARVVLSGGCFQNLRLAASIRQRLSARGFEVYTPALYPPNDGGISLGQAYVARMSQGAAVIGPASSLGPDEARSPQPERRARPPSSRRP
jgi:hydrogenase maturation protein HypF